MRASGENALSSATCDDALAAAQALGERIADDLAAQGAAELIAESREL